MLTAAENDLLCRVEGDAPMGAMMRRYWTPACLTEEIAEPDCDPVRVRLFGENLVAFRDSEGRAGLMAEQCPHRKASLFFGRNEEGGLRCLYHGWKFDVDGHCVDMSSEPSGSTLCEKVRHRAYPTREAGGVLWAYLGPAAHMPEFHAPIFAPTPTAAVAIAKYVVACNWAQGLEGAIDSAHSSSLHSTDMPPARVNGSTATGVAWQRPSTDKSPRLQAQETDYGFRYAAIRRPIQNAATHDYIRVTGFLAPFNVLIPPNNVYNVYQMNVPIDDHTHALYLIAWSDRPGGGVDQEAWRKFTGAQVGIDVDARFNRVNGAAQNYGQDRQAMRLGAFTGIRGFPNQDIAMWESMGGIADRTSEKLGASDLAVVEFRRVMVRAVRAFLDGAPPPALGLSEAERGGLASWERVIPKSVDWRGFDPEAPRAAAE